MKQQSIFKNRRVTSKITLLLAILSLPLFSFQIKNITPKNKKMKTLQIPYESEVINVSADELWKIVGDDFAHVGKWATAVDHSSGSGTPDFEGASCSIRGCDVNAKGFSKVQEKLTEFNPENKSLTYEVTKGMPGFVTKAANRWKIVKVTNHSSKIVMSANMEMKRFMGSLMGGMMKRNLSKLLPQIANDLKVYAETGNISESKKQRLAKLNK